MTGRSISRRRADESTSRLAVNATPVELLRERLDQHGCRPQRKRGYWIALCPAHDDRDESLGFGESDATPGKAYVKCHTGCGDVDVLEALGLTVADLYPPGSSNGNGSNGSRIVATYDYVDDQGELLYQAVRFEPKKFRQRQPDGNGGWTWNLRGCRRVLYRLPELLEAVEQGRRVLLVEGEKDADALAAEGLVATTNPMGAGKWSDAYTEDLSGAHVTILPDNDGPGREHAENVARKLDGVAASVSVLELDGLPPGGDVSTWLADGHDRQELTELVRSAEPWRAGPPAAGRRPGGRTLTELVAAEFPEPRWVIPKLIPEGATLLVGPAKVGKSWLALALGIAVASGGKAFGSIPVEQGDALVLALEDPPRRLQDRAVKLLGDDPPTDRLTLYAQGECPRADEGGLEIVEQWLDQAPDPRLIVVDVMAKFRARPDTSKQLYDDAYDAVGPLKELADRHQVGLVVLHHTNKNTGTTDWLDRVLGSTGFAASVDTVAMLARPRGSSQGELKLTGRDVEERELPLKFSPQIGTWELVDPEEVNLGDSRREVLEAVREAGEATPRGIATATSLNYSYVRSLVRRMVEAGQLSTDGDGKYRPPQNTATPETGATPPETSAPEDPLATETRCLTPSSSTATPETGRGGVAGVAGVAGDRDPPDDDHDFDGLVVVPPVPDPVPATNGNGTNGDSPSPGKALCVTCGTALGVFRDPDNGEEWRCLTHRGAS